MTKLKKPVKIILIVLGAILVLLVAAALILPKPLAMSVYNDNFGVRFTTYEPLAWSIDDFDGLRRDRYTFESDKGQLLTGYKYYRDGTDAKGLVVLAQNDEKVVLSAKNIPTVQTTLTSTLNVYDVMKAGTVVLTKDAVALIEEVYA